METDIHPPIVVGHDGSAGAHLALRWSVDEALRTGDPLLVMHVLEAPQDAAAWRIELAGQARRMVEDAVLEAVDRNPELTIATQVRVGSPAETLCGISKDARMLVLGSHGQGLSGILTGSVSVAAATHAACPVVVVRCPPEELRGLPVVAGFDESTHGLAALERGFAEAAVRDVAVVVLHAWHPPPPDPRLGAYLRSEEIAEFESAELRAVHRQVDRIARRHPQVLVRIRLVAGPAGAALAQAAEQAQLVVVGSRERVGVAGLLLGSTGLHLLHHATCPVMIVRPVPERQPL